jgi:kynureninase
VKRHFARFLQSDPQRLHVAAHSHHPWPDVTFEAQQRAWLDAARHQDDKWDVVFGTVLPEAQGHVARVLGLPDPATVAFAPNTHEFVRRILSCLPTPPRVLTTDGEFHSFARQVARLEEAGLAVVERVPAEPFGSFPERFAAAAAAGEHDLVFVSHVLFGSGYVVPDLESLVAAVPDDRTLVVVDGYHGFMALPTDFGRLATRAFYIAGGYKYAMAGEGAAFCHCPPGYAPRPVDTGWYAGFGALTDDPGGRVAYPDDGRRFLGATFDPTGLYRFNAVQRLLGDTGWDVAAIHRHVAALQAQLLALLDACAPAAASGVGRASLVPDATTAERGHFLSFAVGDAAALRTTLHARKVVTDQRGERLRIGLGVYHDEADLDTLVARLAGR